MPLRTIPNTDVQYHLISLDEKGVERPENDGSLQSDAVRTILSDANSGITDVFFTMHGWKGDVPAALEQYDRWVGEMARAKADVDVAQRMRPGFKALVIGLHWPSLPWGDEKIEDGVVTVSDTTDGNASIERNVSLFAERIADTPVARTALRTILTAANADGAMPAELPANVKSAYEKLYAESGLTTGNVSAAPGADHEQWSPDALYQEALETQDAPAPGVLAFEGIKEALLMPLRQASFWRMKERARVVGESGGHRLLLQLQNAARLDVRFHLMGHSFGCIVASASITGGAGAQPLVRPVDSLCLVQGALSIWSFCKDIPYASGTPGYFSHLIADGLVKGPIVTTQSQFDKAVRKLYPKAAGLKRQLVLVDEEFPKYGGVGTFGIQGLGKVATAMPMKAANVPYNFTPGRIYNLDANKVIKNGGGVSGAHSDIAHPEVAHAVWESVLAN